MKIKPRLRSSFPLVAKVSAPALLGITLLGFAAPGTASASPATYTAHASADGLVINLFGNQMTGGTATATVNSGTPMASAEGAGTLTPGLIEDQKAAATGANSSQNFPKACKQGGSAPSSSPVGVTLGLACSSATATVANGVPVATATGEIAGLDVNASNVLNQIITGGGDQLFNGIQQVLGQLNGTSSCPDPNASSSTNTSGSTNQSSTTSSTTSPSGGLTALAGTASIPNSPLNTLLGSLGLGSSTAASTPAPLGSLINGLCQTLDNLKHVVASSSAPSTLVVDVGPASASVIGRAGNTADASAKGATAEIQILPGVGCSASTLTACATDASTYAAPLIDIKVAPAEAYDHWDGTVWTPNTKSALVTVDLNIPGDAQTISVGPNQSLDLLAGTPLETVIDLGSASTSGAKTANGSDTANGATLDVAKGVNGGILLDLGSSSVTGGDKSATVDAAIVPPHSNPANPSVLPQATPPAIAPVGSPTLVHTGAWWSGSLPYIAGLSALGGGLLGWPRLRRGSKSLGMLLRAARR